MSALLGRIKSTLHTDTRCEFIGPMQLIADKDIKEIRDIGQPHNHGFAYTISSQFVQQGFCATSKELAEIEKQFVAALKREIYGDYVSKIHSLQRATYDRDWSSIEMHLRDLFIEINQS